jgi:hypothetical protein
VPSASTCSSGSSSRTCSRPSAPSAAPSSPANPIVDYLYFSFASLTTVGYGDLTAAHDVSRILAVSEALIDQLYLVTVLALLVGNVGRDRIRGPDQSGPGTGVSWPEW